jgi:hypothetical protein
LVPEWVVRLKPLNFRGKAQVIVNGASKDIKNILVKQYLYGEVLNKLSQPVPPSYQKKNNLAILACLNKLYKI